MLIIRSKLYYAASGIVTPHWWPSRVQVERGLCRGRLPTDVIIPEAVKYNLDLLMMSTQCSKHVEAYNELIVKQEFVH